MHSGWMLQIIGGDTSVVTFKMDFTANDTVKRDKQNSTVDGEQVMTKVCQVRLSDILFLLISYNLEYVQGRFFLKGD